jgi:hypothetical protein
MDKDCLFILFVWKDVDWSTVGVKESSSLVDCRTTWAGFVLESNVQRRLVATPNRGGVPSTVRDKNNTKRARKRKRS